jgi:hypothetical protein
MMIRIFGLDLPIMVITSGIGPIQILPVHSTTGKMVWFLNIKGPVHSEKVAIFC